jgi:hypothetical protein
MKIAILSDIHDNIWALKAALAEINDASVLLFCGDLCSPFTVGLLAEGFTGPIHVVAGNNEGDWRVIAQQAVNFPHIHLHGQFYQDEVDGKRIAVNHYPDIALAIAESGQYDLVCYGHNHSFAIEQHGTTLTINPGALMGYNPIKKQDIPATFVIYDTTENQAVGYQVVRKANSDSQYTGVSVYP